MDEKKEAGRVPTSRNKGALFAETYVSMSSYRVALGSKIIEDKQSQANNNLQRARKHSIS